MMRRINGVAAVVRAARGIAASSPASNNVAKERFHQAALYSTNCNYSTTSRSFSIDRSDHTCGGFAAQGVAAQGVAGTMFFSVAASFAEDVHAKETNPYTKFAPNEVVLYQYEACPFCNKVKAFLDYNKIPYKVVEVNPISKKEIKWSDYKKVPILVVDGQQMVDSSVIIDQLSQKLHPEVTSESLPDINEEEKIWRGWVDNHLVHVLSPNIYRSPSEALESFDYITSHGNFSFFERMTGKYVGAAAMYFVSKKLKKKHNIIDERATLYEAAEKWSEALKGREFLGGENPNLADLAVFGVLRPIRYLQSGRDMVENTRIGEWYSRMEKIVGSSRITT